MTEDLEPIDQYERDPVEPEPTPTGLRAPQDPPLTLLFILGYPHSGTTIVGNVLGAIEGFFHAGEVHYLWERNLRGSEQCSCRHRTSECVLWSRILDADVRHGVAARKVVAMQRRSIRSANLPRLLATPSRVQPRDDGLAAYLRVIADLYRRMASETGARVIVDSSKWPADGAAARLLGPFGIDTYFLHLVRDPVDVIASRQRILIRTRAGRLDTPHLIYDSLGWSGLNLAARLVRARHGRRRSLLMSYEDFIRAPRHSVSRIMRFLGEGGRPPFIDDQAVSLSTEHSLGGSRQRFETGVVRVRRYPPEAVPSARDRLLCRAITFPVASFLSRAAAADSNGLHLTGDLSLRRNEPPGPIAAAH
jgi:hypothetical protein